MKSNLPLLIVAVLLTSGCTTTGLQKEHLQQNENGEITEVVDGDTVDIRISNGTETVRLLGVDTPEVHVENSPEEFEKIPDTPQGRKCLERWGEKASQFARQELAGEKAELVTDPRSDVRGSYGRLLGYIRNDGENFNYQLVKKGYARVYESGFTRQQKFLEAEQKAQKRMKGLWRCRTFEIENLTVKGEER